jgi:hypothetical protein
MIISTPEILLKNGEVIVSAKVTFQKPLLNKPEIAWFAFPESYLPYISGRADAFAAGLLPLALAIREDLTIEGELSPRLLYGLNEYQHALNLLFPNQFTKLTIQANNLAELSAKQAGQACATLFSGGVDSTFTLMSHVPESQPIPDLQVKYAIFVHGFDIPLQNKTSYQQSLEVFSQYLPPLGVEVISCRTNLQYFTSGLLKWGIAHGGAIISVGLVLDKLIRYFLVPSSFSLDDLVPCGSSPVIDHWLSTETLQVIHDGAAFTRVEKVEAISAWQPAQHFLRVCMDEGRRSGVNNCSRCEKCLRAMIRLDIFGTLKSFETFRQPFGWREIMLWTPMHEEGDAWMFQLMRLAMDRGKAEYIFPLWVAHLRGLFRLWARKMIPKPLFNYLKKRKFPYRNDLFNPCNLDINR